jgi:hypothetical protein
MQAVRLARYHSRRSHLVRFCGAYHGWWGDVQPGVGNPVPARETYTLKDMDPAALTVLRTLRLSPNACRARALKSGWDLSSRQFESNLAPCRDMAAGQFRVAQPKLILASRFVRESALDKASSSSIRPSRTRL